MGVGEGGGGTRVAVGSDVACRSGVEVAAMVNELVATSVVVPDVQPDMMKTIAIARTENRHIDFGKLNKFMTTITEAT